MTGGRRFSSVHPSLGFVTPRLYSGKHASHVSQAQHFQRTSRSIFKHTTLYTFLSLSPSPFLSRSTLLLYSSEPLRTYNHYTHTACMYEALIKKKPLVKSRSTASPYSLHSWKKKPPKFAAMNVYLVLCAESYQRQQHCCELTGLLWWTGLQAGGGRICTHNTL